MVWDSLVTLENGNLAQRDVCIILVFLHECMFSRFFANACNFWHKLGYFCRSWAVTKPHRYPVWVPGLRIDPLRLLAGCHKRRLNETPINLRGLIWLLSVDWSERGNIWKRGPSWDPSARTQLFAADRRTSDGSKKEETRRCPAEETDKRHQVKNPIGVHTDMLSDALMHCSWQIRVLCI